MTVDWRWVQSRLHDLGFNPGPVDGVRGPRTDAALVAFKKSIGFRARPFVGPLTLEALEPAPGKTSVPWMSEAMRMKGLHEQRDVGVLRRWFDSSLSWIDPSEIPWCGAFVATCYRQWDKDIPLPNNPLGARNWREFGIPTHPVLGACLVFWRGSPQGWKGHVGFYYGEDNTHFHVLGGNQSNAVTVSRISKTRLLSSRWPTGQEIEGQTVHLARNGAKITENEA